MVWWTGESDAYVCTLDAITCTMVDVVLRYMYVVVVVLRWKDESDRLLPTAVHLEGPCM